MTIDEMDALIGFGKPASKTADWIVNTYLPNAPVSYRLSIEHAIATAILEAKVASPGPSELVATERLDLGNLRVIVECMTCTGKLPHGCPNCKGLDFCVKRHAQKTLDKLEAHRSAAPREITMADDVPNGYSPDGKYAWKAGWNACVGYITGKRELPQDVADRLSAVIRGTKT